MTTYKNKSCLDDSISTIKRHDIACVLAVLCISCDRLKYSKYGAEWCDGAFVSEAICNGRASLVIVQKLPGYRQDASIDSDPICQNLTVRLGATRETNEHPYHTLSYTANITATLMPALIAIY